jgi:hypothetical protein
MSFSKFESIVEFTSSPYSQYYIFNPKRFQDQMLTRERSEKFLRQPNGRWLHDLEFDES